MIAAERIAERLSWSTKKAEQFIKEAKQLGWQISEDEDGVVFTKGSETNDISHRPRDLQPRRY